MLLGRAVLNQGTVPSIDAVSEASQGLLENYYNDGVSADIHRQRVRKQCIERKINY